MSTVLLSGDVPIRCPERFRFAVRITPIFTIVGKEYTITVGESTIHMSAEGTIEITATNIQVVGNEYVEIKGKKVCVNGGCEGEKKLKASSVKEEVYNQQFRLKNKHTGEILVNTKYKLTASTGEVLEGISDENGMTERIHTKVASKIMIEILHSEDIYE